MALWSLSFVRILLATTAAMIIGGIYFNPQVNPLSEIWLKYTYPKVDDPRMIKDPMLPMLGTAVCFLISATLFNNYVNTRQVALTRLITMAVELWILTVTFQLPHALWSNQNLKPFMIERLYDLLVALALSLALGYKRFPVMTTSNSYEPVSG